MSRSADEREEINSSGLERHVCERIIIMMKIGEIEYGTTEMTNTPLELWSCEFTIEGLQTNCSMRAVVHGHIPQFQP